MESRGCGNRLGCYFANLPGQNHFDICRTPPTYQITSRKAAQRTGRPEDFGGRVWACEEHKDAVVAAWSPQVELLPREEVKQR